MTNDILIFICSAVISYLIGSLSPAIAISKLNNKNIMEEGSGNAGATNAVRVLGWKWGLCVFCIDLAKGFLTVFLFFIFFGSYTSFVAGIFVVVGHVFSLYHNFKAGKGVAPSIGVLLAVNWQIAFICLACGLLLVLITRRVSVGSVASAIILPFVTWFIFKPFIFAALVISILIVFNHRSNIKRLFKGEEKPLFKFDIIKRSKE